MNSSLEGREPAAEEVGPASLSTARDLLTGPGLRPDDPMSEAGRKILRFHYRRMVFHEPGTRLGEDIEALHDMRVATRRMRAALRVFDQYYKLKAIAPHQKGLRRTGRALGQVRDLDVFRVKILMYQATLPADQQVGLDAFLAVLELQRELARERMLRHLDGSKYAQFVERFGQFVETEGLGSRHPRLTHKPVPFRVCHVAPVSIYSRLASVRAYDELVTIPNPPPDRLHALRIACRRLRYTLEFFREVLAPSTKVLIKEIVSLQDHLGNLQDAVVAGVILRQYLQHGTWDQRTAVETVPGAPQNAAGVQRYLTAKEAEQEHLIDTFPEAWQRIVSRELSQAVAEAVATL